MPHVATNLSAADEEIQRRHPLVGAQPRLPRKVVQMGDQPFHEVLESCIVALRVDANGVGCDVVDRQIQELWCVLSHCCLLIFYDLDAGNSKSPNPLFKCPAEILTAFSLLVTSVFNVKDPGFIWKRRSSSEGGPLFM